MHGLINKTLQHFLLDTYGPAAWAAIARNAKADIQNFEAMLSYPAQVTSDVLNAAADYLGKPKDSLLEDLGTYLVSHPNCGVPRRLLRFSGVDFLDFLNAFDDLPDRARLAVPDLILPQLEVEEKSLGLYELHCVHDFASDAAHVLLGLLRAMADDYGALVLMDVQHQSKGHSLVSVQLIEAAYASGNNFELGVIERRAT